jgi:hypothetical protein
VAGHNMDVIKILPPLIITEREVDYFVNAFDSAVQDCGRFPGPMVELARNTAFRRLNLSHHRNGARAPESTQRTRPPAAGLIG